MLRNLGSFGYDFQEIGLKLDFGGSPEVTEGLATPAADWLCDCKLSGLVASGAFAGSAGLLLDSSRAFGSGQCWAKSHYDARGLMARFPPPAFLFLFYLHIGEPDAEFPTQFSDGSRIDIPIDANHCQFLRLGRY